MYSGLLRSGYSRSCPVARGQSVLNVAILPTGRSTFDTRTNLLLPGLELKIPLPYVSGGLRRRASRANTTGTPAGLPSGLDDSVLSWQRRRSELQAATGIKAFTIHTVAATDLRALLPEVAKWPAPSVAIVRGTLLGATSFRASPPDGPLMIGSRRPAAARRSQSTAAYRRGLRRRALSRSHVCDHVFTDCSGALCGCRIRADATRAHRNGAGGAGAFSCVQ